MACCASMDVDHATPTVATQTATRIAKVFCLGVSALVLLALVISTLQYEVRILLTSTVGAPYPQSIYTPMAVPGTSPVANAPGAAGADFSQVYTSALALRHGESAYRPTSPQFADRFGRFPGYPPLMNWLYVPMTFFPYHVALLLHTGLSLGALFAATVFVLGRMGLRRHAWPVILVQATLFFLTPIGFTHLERGQFDLLVAASLLLCFACVYGRAGFGVAAVSGFLGALKWTALPFLGCFSVLGLSLASRSRRRFFLLIPAVVALGTGVFWQGVLEYWTCLRIYEFETPPYGLTLQNLLPRLWTKLAPILATASVAIFAFARFPAAQRPQVLMAISAPFALALINLTICFGTYSYEYHTVALLGMVPALIVWLEAAGSLVPARMKIAISTAFGLFLIVAFRLFGLTVLGYVAMTGIYLALAVFFLATCAYTIHTVHLRRPGARPGP
jgi:hypothetical protein